jgi:hypothetical protein
MEKFKYKIEIEAENTQDAAEKVKNLLIFARKITTEQLSKINTETKNRPDLIPFIVEISEEYAGKEIGLLDAVSVAKKTYQKFIK